MIIDELFEGPQMCPECGGISFSDLILAEKKDACYHKVKASAKVWPSAYASGRLVQCRKKGAANYGNKSEGVAEGRKDDSLDTGPDGKLTARGEEQMRQYRQQKKERERQQIIAKHTKTAKGEPYGVAPSRISQSRNEVDWKEANKELRKKGLDEQGVAEGVMYGAENLNVGDDVIISGDVELNGATGVIDSFGQDKRFVVVDLYNHGRHSFHSSDVSANDYDNDEHDDDLDETRRGQVPMTLNPGETDNIEPENIAGFRQLPAYKQGQAAQQKAGKQLIQKSPYTFQSDQDWAFRQGATDAQRAAMFANFGGTKPLTTEEGEQQKGADYRDPKEVDYDDEYDAMVARVKKLAGLGPMKTVYDPTKRVYRNMPTAQQPKK
jgi:hypothetical protein